MAEGDGVLEFGAFFAAGFEVDGDAEGGADFVLAGVAAADGGGFVVEAVQVLLEQRIDFAGLGDELGLVLQQREDADFDRGDTRVQAQDGDDFLLALLIDLFGLAEGLGDDGERHAVETGGGFDDVRDVAAFEETLEPRTHGGFGHRLAFDLGGFGGETFLDEGFLLLVGELGGGGFEFFVEDLLRLGAGGLVRGQIEVATRGDAFQLLGAEGELAEDVHAGAGVVGEVGGRLPVVFEHVAEADALVELRALIDPVAVPQLPAPIRLRFAQIGAFMPLRDFAADDFDGFVGLDEELELHLLELAAAEGEILRRDLVAEGLADLADAEGHLHAAGVEDVLELREDGLRGFRAQVGHVVLGRGGAEVGLEHEIEGTGLAEHAAGLRMEIHAAVHGIDFLLAEQFDLLGLAGGFTSVLRDEGADAFAEALDVLAIFQQGGDGAVPAPAVRGLGTAVFHDDAVLRLDVVGADAFVRQRALAHEIGEGIDVAAGLPDGGIHEDAGIEAEHVLTFAGHGIPPGGAQVALQLRAERTVVPHAAAAAVDFAALIDEAAALAEGDDFLHLRLGCFGVGHGGCR